MPPSTTAATTNKPCKCTGDSKRGDLDPRDANAGVSHRYLVATDHIDEPPKNSLMHQPNEPGENDEKQNEGNRQYTGDEGRSERQVRVIKVCVTLLAADEQRKRPIGGHRAKRYGKRRLSKADDEQAIDQTGDDAETDDEGQRDPKRTLISESRARRIVPMANVAGTEMSISPTRTTVMRPADSNPVTASACCKE
jgi:hypothetical protein